MGAWAWALALGGGAAILSLAAAAASGRPVPPPTTSGRPVTMSHLWDGTSTAPHPPPGVPDDYLFPGPDTGRLWFLWAAKQTNVSKVPVSWSQASFAYTKALLGLPEAINPNLDGLGSCHSPPNSVGTIVGGGGLTPRAPDTLYACWRQWTQPLPCTSAIRVQTGGTMGLGNSTLTELSYVDAGPATEIRFLGSQRTASGFSASSEKVPTGSRWLVETAFLQASGDYAATLRRASDGFVLASHPGGTRNQSSGGYSTQQTSVPLGGTQTVWPAYVYLGAGDSIVAEVQTPSAATVAYFVNCAQIPA
ncbi:MAG: hypothetical protein B7Z78_13455 [Rhodospirillales bacterium 20-60-12]|nr:MAG: hypothetical protein B7Z78_13455 [Rhodospirillales bacterium 20-60-12]